MHRPSSPRPGTDGSRRSPLAVRLRGAQAKRTTEDPLLDASRQPPQPRRATASGELPSAAAAKPPRRSTADDFAAKPAAHKDAGHKAAARSGAADEVRALAVPLPVQQAEASCMPASSSALGLDLGTPNAHTRIPSRRRHSPCFHQRATAAPSDILAH
jgi:hypothetical protein